MKYQVQIFYPISMETPEVGNWVDTTYGGDDYNEVADRVTEMASRPQDFTKIRIIEPLLEFATQSRACR